MLWVSRTVCLLHMLPPKHGVLAFFCWEEIPLTVLGGLAGWGGMFCFFLSCSCSFNVLMLQQYSYDTVTRAIMFWISCTEKNPQRTELTKNFSGHRADLCFHLLYYIILEFSYCACSLHCHSNTSLFNLPLLLCYFYVSLCLSNFFWFAYKIPYWELHLLFQYSALFLM